MMQSTRQVRRTHRYLICAALVAGLWTELLLAQPGTASLEEVIVTAERKQSSLQDTPISLAVFDKHRLEIDGIGNLVDIAAKVPSVTIQPFPTDSSTLRILIRGVGLIDSQISQDPSIAVYTDGIYIARSLGLALDVADLERLEILRGPQGTLYGRNATGGAVNLITRRPELDELQFSQAFTVGNRNLLLSKTSVNLPVGDRAAVKFAWLQNRIDGFVANGGPGGDWGDREAKAGRIDFRWNISDTLTVDYSYDDTAVEFFNYTYQAVTPGTFRGSTIDLVQQNANDHVRAGPGYSAKRLRRLNSHAPLEVSTNDISGHALILTWEVGEQTELQYLFGHRELDNRVYTDLGSGASDETFRLDSNVYVAPDGRAFPLVTLDTLQDQSSHEIKISGEWGDGRLEYMAGAYYFEEDAQLDATPLYHLFHSTIDEDDAGPLGPNAVIVSADFRRQAVANKAWAIYSRWTWTPAWLDERLSVTFGGRHSADKRAASNHKMGEALACQPELMSCATLSTTGFEAGTGDRYRDDSFAFIAEYRIADDINVYLKAEEAYRAGGFNVRDPHESADSQGNEYGFGFVEGFSEEKVEVLELGLKSQFLDNRLRFNAALFFQQLVDQQINFLFGGNIADTKATNVGESSMDGIETELAWLITPSHRLAINYAYLDAEVEKAIDPISGRDVSGEFSFFSAPMHSATAMLDWALMSGEWGRLDLYLSYNYMAERAGTAATNAISNTLLDQYGLWNARLALTGLSLWSGAVDISLWGKNLLDEEYAVDAINNLPQADRAVVWGEPRAYGVDLVWRI